MARILIADDDPHFIEAFSQAMEALGHSATGMQSGTKALDAIRQNGYDIVFLDVLMPGGGAISLVHAVRDIAPDLPIVIITGNAAMLDAPIMTEGLKQAQARISKTATLEELATLIGKLVS